MEKEYIDEEYIKRLNMNLEYLEDGVDIHFARSGWYIPPSEIYEDKSLGEIIEFKDE